MPLYRDGVQKEELLAEFQRQSGNPSATIDDMFATVMAKGTQFVSQAALTLDQLHTQFPPNEARKGVYARVSDLFGQVDEIMRCRFDGVNYRWVPQRDDFNQITAVQGGTVQLIPLVTPPTIRFTANTLSSNLNIQPSTTNAHVGQRFRVIMNPMLNLGLLTAQISGLIGSNLTLLAGSTRDIEYGPTGWFQA